MTMKVKAIEKKLKFTKDPNDPGVYRYVKSSLITTRRIIFTPDVDLKDELKNTAIQITCYDRDGKEVKRVLSSDDAEVEDNEANAPSTGGNTGGSGGNGGGNGGGGDDDTPNEN